MKNPKYECVGGGGVVLFLVFSLLSFFLSLG